MSEFSPTWEEWIYSTVAPQPHTWITDTSGESQFYLGANVSFTVASILASSTYYYYFGVITPEMIALHGSRAHAAGYMATGSPGAWNTLRILRNSPPYIAAGVASDAYDAGGGLRVDNDPHNLLKSSGVIESILRSIQLRLT